MRISTIGFALALAVPLLAQQKTMTCSQHDNNQKNQVTHCEICEQTLGFAGQLSIDAGANGGVSVKAWDGAGVLVRSKIEASAEDAGRASALASQIRVDVSAGEVSASGPEASRGHGWSVAYEVFVPRQADLKLKTLNGAISISDVRGNIQFGAVNGAVSLKRLAGSVEGHTENGALNIELAGDRWDGVKLDARTTNGGINVSMPERYSAHFETATVNGTLSLNIPTTMRGETGKRVVTDLGSGGPTVHVETTNGGVTVKRAS
jgi:DUF4097 and DUF4098 domain-containing protein YvlB